MSVISHYLPGVEKHPTVPVVGCWGFHGRMAPEECEVVEAEELAEYQRRCGLETEHQEH